MIVYNVKRRFFAMKADADAYRRMEGLKPSALAKLEIVDRAELATLLNALAEPTPQHLTALPETVAPTSVIDGAFIAPDFDIPAFLRESWAKHRSRQGEAS
ncbi:hypothetical protein [Shinella sp. BYT-45]|uniref:hypothetical protein n=1 Tax=Shinella sp. BYT-45 TaxID=3377377 RepID=UPI0039810381